MKTSLPLFLDFHSVISELESRMREDAQKIHTEKWQGVWIAGRPEAAMHEILFPAFRVPLAIYGENLKTLAGDIRPNLPWADEHFEQERVGGQPLNPGETWMRWPWGQSAAKFRGTDNEFTHTYAERYWPRFAGHFPGGILPKEATTYRTNQGIRYAYGDLNDVVDLLTTQPLTRQAYLPIFFPEDTGAVHGGRIPCSLGYHFLCRENKLHITYQLRSCDLYRHLRDDIYLTVRLLLWVLQRLRKSRTQTFWSTVIPGDFCMLIGSLHIFVNDLRALNAGGDGHSLPKGV